MHIPIHVERPGDESEEQDKVKEQQTTAEAGVDACDHEEFSREETAYLRLRADFENLKKRQAKEIQKGVERELTVFLRKFLTISDDLERAIPFCQESSANGGNDELLEGLCLIQKRLHDLLKESGLERIEAVGKPFDPLRHEAVIVEEPDPEVGSNTVTGEIEAGYLFRGTLLRPAKVTVAQ